VNVHIEPCTEDCEDCTSFCTIRKNPKGNGHSGKGE
jgi:hypothetical protein